MEPGISVRILPPFAEAFPDVYVIRSITDTTAMLIGIPEGFADAFDVSFLEVAND